MLHGGHCGCSVRPTERRKGHATFMLSQAVKLASELGIDRLLLTCDPSNLGSAKTITNNEGILQDVIRNKESGDDTARYWIKL